MQKNLILHEAAPLIFFTLLALLTSIRYSKQNIYCNSNEGIIYITYVYIDTQPLSVFNFRFYSEKVHRTAISKCRTYIYSIE